MKIGSNNAAEDSIETTLDIEKINNFFYKNLPFIQNYLDNNKDDQYANELFENFKKTKKFLFPINKHIEIFILKNQSKIEKIIKYAIFRYKFYIAGKKQINLGYPPYLLIEPVSACNL